MISTIRLTIFMRVYRLDHWVRGRFTAMGRILLGTLIAVGLFALNPRITQAWLLAIVLLTIIVIAIAQAPLFRPQINLRRQLPAYATVGHDLHYHVLVENRSQRDLDGFQIREHIMRIRTRDLLKSKNSQSTWFRFHRTHSYQQFVRLMGLMNGFRSQRSSYVQVRAGRQTRLSLSFSPLRRGYLNLSRLRAERVDPLGIFLAWYQHTKEDRLLVLPRRFPLRWRDNSGKNKRHGSGRAQSSSTGGSVDFARLREYRHGDPMRHIHWRAWAHLGTPVVMEFHQQTPGRSALIMDTFVEKDFASDIFEEAISVAASFCSDTQWCDGRLELLLLGEKPVHLGSGVSGSGQGSGIDAMLEALACAQPDTEHSPEQLIKAVRQELDGIEQCICVFMDYDSTRQALLRDLQLNAISLLVLVVHPDAHERIQQPGTMAALTPQLLAIGPGEAAQVLAELPSTQQASLNHV